MHRIQQDARALQNWWPKMASFNRSSASLVSLPPRAEFTPLLSIRFHHQRLLSLLHHHRLLLLPMATYPPWTMVKTKTYI